ncbi:MlaD family protein [Nocardia sp. NBC_00511]|uniref:MlaD family protein n=1 Tax=Nocardia sp. NBC_00511 TaxID=2903591 RepID=UPI0030DE9B83
MQERLRPAWRGFVDFLLGNDRHEGNVRRRQLVLGLGGLLTVLVLMAASAVIYFLPIGKSTYTAMLTEAGALKTGDEVRIAGIQVGSVTSMELFDDAVRMKFTVDDGIFLGDQTTLNVRMLTAIGGHYVAAFPAGRNALGDKPIPADHVTLPYSLAQALQDSAQPLAAIDGNTLRANIDALSAAMAKSPGSIGEVTNAMASFVDVVNKQNTEVNRALDVADEYIGLLGDYRKTIGAMLSKIGIMETTVLDRRAEVTDALRIVTELLSRIAAIEPTWRSQLEPLLDKLFEAKPQLDQLGQRLGEVAGSIHDLGARIQGLAAPQGGLSIDQSGQTVSADAAFCIPVPGKDC